VNSIPSPLWLAAVALTILTASVARADSLATAGVAQADSSATAGVARATGPATPPHIVFFLADDLGWGDVGYHGSEIETPHIDALAQAGVKLDQFYVLPVCSPTRAALLTGRYPIRQGLQRDVVRPWARWGLPEAERTLPQALGEAGYRSLMVGKWHLGHERSSQLPRARGFAHHYGNYLGAGDYFTHRREGGLDWHRNGKPLEEPGYATFLLANEAMWLIRGHDPAQPLFLYVSFTAPHAPLQVPAHWEARYADLQSPARRSYAAMVSVMDEAIGRILAVLRERGMAENTLVVFASDNGGLESQGADNGPLRGGKGELYEGGVRVPAVVSWPARLPEGTSVAAPIHIVDWYPTLLGLAGASREQPLPIDGRDIGAVLAGEAQPDRAFLYNVEKSGGAVRSGRWKLLQDASGTELFDLATDPGELRNVAAEQPDTARALAARLAAWAAESEPAAFDATQREGHEPPAIWGPAAPEAARH